MNEADQENDVKLSEDTEAIFKTANEKIRQLHSGHAAAQHAAQISTAVLYAAKAIATEIAALRRSNENLAKLHGNPYRG